MAQYWDYLPCGFVRAVLKPRKGLWLFMRTVIYIDGFNLYYGSLKGTPHKWLDLCGLFDRILPDACRPVEIKYYTAHVSSLPHDPNAPVRQGVYLRALRAHCGARLQIRFGHFSVKNVWMPTADDPDVKAKVIKTEEKGSDVNLAVDLVHDAWSDLFDCAVVVSNDADLEHALQITKQVRRKRVLLVTPGAPVRKPLASLVKWAHKNYVISTADLAACQLPAQVVGLNKPATW